MRKLAYILLLLVFFTNTYSATQPKFLIIPTTDVNISLNKTTEAIVQYRVTNQTALTRQLTMVSISGIEQLVDGANYCGNPFTLAQGQSCLLTLKAYGSKLNVGTTNVAVEVCKTQSNQNTPDPFLCSKTSSSNNLNISVRIRPRLSVTPRILQLAVGGPSVNLRVTNLSSTDTATNIKAFINNTALSGNVTLNDSSCASVDPGTTCSITFTPGNTAVSLTFFRVQGDNTLPTPAGASITDSTTAQISVSGSPLVLTAGGSSGTLVVTNLSSTVTATNVQANLPQGVIESVTQDISNCVSVAPGGTCNLIFTPTSTALSPTTIEIYGNNTSVAQAVISVNSPTTAELLITSNLPLILKADGATTGTMKIFNNSTSITAENVTANFSSTSLSGYVTATSCSSIAPQGSCTMTFTPGYNTTPPTYFPISGTNTTTVNGEVSISPYYLYFVNLSDTSGNVVRCNLSLTDGKLSSCSNVLSSLPWPTGITFNQDGSYAYISVGNPAGVKVCEVSSGALSNCSTTNLQSSSGSYADGITYNPQTNVIYISTFSNQIYKCTLKTSGVIDTCAAQSSVSTLYFPIGISVNPFGTYSYVANLSSSSASITKCTTNTSSGDLSSCSTQSGVGNYAYGIAVNPANTFAYYSRNNNNSIAWATINSGNGALTYSGELILSGVSYPVGLVLNAATNYIYVGVKSNPKIYLCTVSLSGSISGCADAVASSITSPVGLALYPNPP